jgi:hypothetical protein
VSTVTDDAAAPLATWPEPRPVPSWLRPDGTPEQAVADLLRRHRSELAAAQAEAAAWRHRADALAEAVGLALSKKRAALRPEQFRSLAELLASQSIVLIERAGSPLTPEIEEVCDIVARTPADAAASPGAFVAEDFEPEIRFEGRLVHRARLCIAHPPAPPAAKPAPPSKGAPP